MYLFLSVNLSINSRATERQPYSNSSLPFPSLLFSSLSTTTTTSMDEYSHKIFARQKAMHDGTITMEADNKRVKDGMFLAKLYAERHVNDNAEMEIFYEAMKKAAQLNKAQRGAVRTAIDWGRGGTRFQVIPSVNEEMVEKINQQRRHSASGSGIAEENVDDILLKPLTQLLAESKRLGSVRLESAPISRATSKVLQAPPEEQEEEPPPKREEAKTTATAAATAAATATAAALEEGEPNAARESEWQEGQGDERG